MGSVTEDKCINSREPDASQTIEQQQEANHKLTMQLQQEQQAVEYQQRIANKLRKQVEQSNERIKTILQ
ncbi:MAG: DUF2570 domain-containing protein, partial [[Pasteurella] aerogenes]|nr:DUF2570 domain-containing protein [[Pasteurella] aerogenes]